MMNRKLIGGNIEREEIEIVRGVLEKYHNVDLVVSIKHKGNIEVTFRGGI
jgi:hypothetical protein|tara:strand:- start:892 stop:1041 length:150 start_codon:yes stop_codon:yes gene_type:complete